MRIDSYLSLQRQIRTSKKQVDRALLQLTTQKRINTASDDIAGSAALSRIKATLSSLKQVNEKNMPQAESALDLAATTADQIYIKLKEVRLLAEESSDPLLTDKEREDLNTQYQAGLSDLQDLVTSKEYNTHTLFDGSFSVKIQVGTSAGQTQSIQLADFTLKGLSLSSSSVDTQDHAETALKYIDLALEKTVATQSSVATYQTSLEFRKDANAIEITNLEKARSQIEDLDIAEGVSALSEAQTNYQSQIRLLQNALSTQKDAWSLLFSKF